MCGKRVRVELGRVRSRTRLDLTTSAPVLVAGAAFVDGLGKDADTYLPAQTEKVTVKSVAAAQEIMAGHSRFYYQLGAASDAVLKAGLMRMAGCRAFYHYGSVETICSILRTGMIWLTNIKDLCDLSEYVHGLNLIISEIERAASQHLAGRDYQILLEHTSSRLKQSPELEDCFVASFCDAGDDINLWQQYGNSSRGVSLGISRMAFEREGIGSDTDVEPVVYAINYSEQDCVDAARAVLDEARLILLKEKLVDRDYSEIRLHFLNELVAELIIALAKVALLFKHPKYQDEKEIRLLLFEPQGELDQYVKVFRRPSGATARYIPVPIKPPLAFPGLIEQITAGPAATEGAEQQLSAVLNGLGSERHVLPRLVVRSRLPNP